MDAVAPLPEPARITALAEEGDVIDTASAVCTNLECVSGSVCECQNQNKNTMCQMHEEKELSRGSNTKAGRPTYTELRHGTSTVCAVDEVKITQHNEDQVIRHDTSTLSAEAESTVHPDPARSTNSSNTTDRCETTSHTRDTDMVIPCTSPLPPWCHQRVRRDPVPLGEGDDPTTHECENTWSHLYEASVGWSDCTEHYVTPLTNRDDTYERARRADAAMEREALMIASQINHSISARTASLLATIALMDPPKVKDSDATAHTNALWDSYESSTSKAMASLLTSVDTAQAVADAYRPETVPGETHADSDGRDNWKENYFCGMEPYPDEEKRPLSDSRIYLKTSREVLEADLPSQNFFLASLAPTPEKRTDENDRRYQSMRAVFKLEDKDGSCTSTPGVVDSGAAFNALQLKYAQRHMPEAMKGIQPVGVRFRDAQGHRMKLAGKINLAVWLGSHRYLTEAYVFEELGAEFLLGVNAICRNGLIIDGHTRRIYRSGQTPADGIDLDVGQPPTTGQDHAIDLVQERTAECGLCNGDCPDGSHLLCDADGCRVTISTGGRYDQIGCDITPSPPRARWLPLLRPGREDSRPRISVYAPEAIVLAPGTTRAVEMPLTGVAPGRLEPVQLELSETLRRAGLTSVDAELHNPTNEYCFMTLHNPSVKMPCTIAAGTMIGSEPEHLDEVSTDGNDVTVAVDISWEGVPGAPRPLDCGGIDDLHALGFTLENSIDPALRRDDGSYEPLSEAKKMRLYSIAHRWWYVWAKDAKVPNLSYMVVLDIPTGDSPPITIPPYGIPQRFKQAAMLEVNKLLKAGLIEPSMSNWASPVLVRLKKDSTAEEIRLKLIIDYRRLNAVTRLDAGGLGTQSDLLHSIGGANKYIGLCDAAGGFYQFALSPESRAKSAFILPTSMGGTLFQWRVAPYGLTRNPAGYSRGMQFVLKDLSICSHLGDGHGCGGATSWLDDICMRADSFEGFLDLFNVVLSRLACAGISLKGAKCELLLPAMDLLGFSATPHGLYMQQPKLQDMMRTGIPSTAEEIRTFLGCVNFCRRWIPRLSLLGAPMTAILKRADKLTAKAKTLGRRSGGGYIFSDSDHDDARQAFEAITAHLSSDAVMSVPDFEDPLAEFVLCTDACDIAVGGSLMQWQYPGGKGPGPPPGANARNMESPDPLNKSWRIEAGWELKMIGYYSKTLVEAQKHYTAFDKEAGAVLLCVRHWSDLITYHPTTVYTDSAVASSLLKKHMAPPRLQRWGVELGTYLPHLKIGYRKGASNGLADLLSRFPTFRQFVRLPGDQEVIPDSLHEIGTAPMYAQPEALLGSTSHLHQASYRLFDPPPRGTTEAPDGFWTGTEAPEIPGRGMTDRVSTSVPEAMLARLEPESSTPRELVYALDRLGDHVQACANPPASVDWSQYVEVFTRTFCRNPSVDVVLPSVDMARRSPSSDALVRELTCAGFDVHPVSVADPLASDLVLDVFCRDPRAYLCMTDGSAPTLGHATDMRTTQGLTSVSSNVPLRALDRSLPSGRFAPENNIVVAAHQLVALLLQEELGVPALPRAEQSYMLSTAMDSWARHGYLQRGLHERQLCAMEDDSTSSDGEGSPDGEGGPNHPTPPPEPEEAPPPKVDVDYHPCLADQRRDAGLRVVIETLLNSRRQRNATRRLYEDDWEIKGDTLHRLSTNDSGDVISLIAIPEHARPAIMARHHYALCLCGGHTGGKQLYDSLRDVFYWSNMYDSCKIFVHACEKCGSTRSQSRIHVPRGSVATPSKPFEVIHVDHKGPLPRLGDMTHILVVVCALTGYVLYIPVKTTGGEDSLTAMITCVFSIFGTPLVIISDNGTAFANRLIKAAASLYGYRWIYVKAGTPKSNGLAEVNVKRIKNLLDRHTDEYQDWVHILPMAQMLMNQRTHSRSGMSAFSKLFGRSPNRLPALENPSTLVAPGDGLEFVRNLAARLRRLHARLATESDSLKAAACTADKKAHAEERNFRGIQTGDMVWVTISDASKAAYVRKHGHGAPWRFPYKVVEVKPHAVRLERPDGSRPTILPWQHLSKCSLAPPTFHDEELDLPEVDDCGRVLAPVPAPNVPPPQGPFDAPPADASQDDDGWASWRPERLYEIERITRAYRQGSGWRVVVKWKDNPETTPERLSSILRQTQHPDILKEIEEAKRRYLDENPVAPSSSAHPDVDGPLGDAAAPAADPMANDPEPPVRGRAARLPRTTDKPSAWVYLLSEPLSEEPMSPTHWRHLSKSLMRLCHRSIYRIAASWYG